MNIETAMEYKPQEEMHDCLCLADAQADVLFRKACLAIDAVEALQKEVIRLSKLASEMLNCVV